MATRHFCDICDIQFPSEDPEMWTLEIGRALRSNREWQNNYLSNPKSPYGKIPDNYSMAQVCGRCIARISCRIQELKDGD